MIYSESEYNELKAIYAKEFKKIEIYETQNRKLTTNTELLKGYKRDIVTKHNFVANYLRNTYPNIQKKGPTEVRVADQRILGLVASTKRIFNILNLE